MLCTGQDVHLTYSIAVSGIEAQQALLGLPMVRQACHLPCTLTVQMTLHSLQWVCCLMHVCLQATLVGAANLSTPAVPNTQLSSCGAKFLAGQGATDTAINSQSGGSSRAAPAPSSSDGRVLGVTLSNIPVVGQAVSRAVGSGPWIGFVMCVGLAALMVLHAIDMA